MNWPAKQAMQHSNSAGRSLRIAAAVTGVATFVGSTLFLWNR
jgi:hypothetical protein